MSIVRYGVVAVAVLSCGGWGPIAVAARPGQDTNIRSSNASEDRHADHAQHVEHAQHEEVVRIERQYRHRLARLNRLRELAEQQNAPDRLAELDELYDRLRKHRNKARDLCETGHDHRRAGHAGRSEKSEKSERFKRVNHGRTQRAHRADHRESRRDRRQIRGAARDRAEQRWLDARHETGVKVHAPTHMNHAASRLAEKRWREEAHDRGAQRWERAARRSGMLDDVRPSSVSRRPGHRRGAADISQQDADREFERLQREIGVRE